MNKPAKYRKIYTDIEALQWDGFDFVAMSDFIWGKKRKNNPGILCGPLNYFNSGAFSLKLKNCNGERVCNIGDFMVKTPTGCVYPLSPESFHMSYAVVKEEKDESTS